MNRRHFLFSGVAALAATATPALASRQCVDAVIRPGFVNLEVAAMARNDRLLATIESSSRVQRVLETGPRIYEGLKSGRYEPITRRIDVTVMLWMKSGFEQVAAVHEGVRGLQEFDFTKVRPSLDCDYRTVGRGAFIENMNRLPSITNRAGLSTPHLAFKGTIRSYGIGWSFSYDFLRQVEYIMICPNANTLWPRRTGGRDEGLIITTEEIARWIRRRDTYALAGIIDSV